MHFCHDDEGGKASLAVPEVDDKESAGVAAMAATRLGRGVQIARNKKADSSRSRPSQLCGVKLWSARE